MVAVAAIVPAYNERPRIGPLVEALCREVDEVIVADAGSPDGTAEAAARSQATVVQARQKGRGSQLRAGVEGARCPALVFVHADTGIPPGFGAAIRQALANPAVVGGNFRLRYEPESPTARCLSLANELRRRVLGTAYGDSCLFARRAAYDAVGGFPDQPLMEDYAFVRALRRRGPTTFVTEPVVTSSARRFEGRALKTLALWALLQAGYELGVPPERLASWYRDVR